MTSLLVRAAQMPLPIDLSALTPMSKMTEQQFYDFCRTNPDLRIEQNAKGEIIVMPPAFSDTGNRNSRVLGQIFIWSEADGSGEAFDSSSGFTLPDGTIRSPDAAWILSERWNALSPEQQASFAPIAPDFVVELRSSSDTLLTLQEKMQEYMANGVQLGLLIDRKNRQVYVYRRDHEPESLDNPEFVSCEPEMPGFILRMDRIW